MRVLFGVQDVVAQGREDDGRVGHPSVRVMVQIVGGEVRVGLDIVIGQDLVKLGQLVFGKLFEDGRVAVGVAAGLGGGGADRTVAMRHAMRFLCSAEKSGTSASK